MRFWTWLAEKCLNETRGQCAPIALAEIEAARSVLFAVFARYGDSVIAFKAIRDFLRRFPGKRCVLVTTPQVYPYAQALLGSEVEYRVINKHRSVAKIAMSLMDFRRHPFDIAFNPWGHGKESEVFISFSRRYYPYSGFAVANEWRNHYERTRQYLGLPQPEECVATSLPERAKRIVISPFSTDPRRSLDGVDLGRLIALLRSRYPDPLTTIACFREEARHVPKDVEVELLQFRKTCASSREFLDTLRRCDLFVGVDTGPLHLADALRIPSMGIFGPTPPERVLDRQTCVVPVRISDLDGVFCEVRACRDPECLHAIFSQPSAPGTKAIDFGREMHCETAVCRVTTLNV